jgi:hypothetical protein
MSNSKTYDNIGLYIADADTLVEKITRYDAIIASMETALETAVISGHLEEYWLDDGQSRTKVTYRNIDDMTKAISGLEMLRQRCINRLNGRSIALRDARGMRNNCR